MSTTEQTRPTVVPATRRDVLHRAADLLEEFGWCQGAYAVPNAGDLFDAPVAFCAVGAIGRAHAELHGGVRTFDALDAVKKYTPETPLQHYNDTLGRTKAEVVARLREAAEATA